MINSLRTRLLISTAAGMTIVLALSGLFLYSLVRTFVYAEFDAMLAAKVRALASLVEHSGEETEFEFDEHGMFEYERSDRPEYYQGWVDSIEAAQSRHLGEHSLPRLGGSEQQPRFASVTLPDGRPGRLVGIRFHPRFDEDQDNPAARASHVEVTLVAAKSTAEVDHALSVFGRTLLAVFLGAAAISLAILYGIVRRGLQPLDVLAGRIRQIHHQNLAARIDMRGVPTELVAVVTRLNELLARLRTAFEREKSFSADVSHELRTPLTGLRTKMEVALSQPREADSYRETIRECLAISRQTQGTVEDLLMLARLDVGGEACKLRPVDVAQLLRECWSPFAADAQSRGVVVEFESTAPLMARADREKLRHVLTNLMNNASCYCDDGGSIRIRAFRRGGMVWVEIINSGNKLSREQLSHAFDRFWRGDVARTGTEQHSGLGLSLCKALMHWLDGDIAVDTPDGATFRVTVSIPHASADEAEVGSSPSTLATNL